jgi:aminoglycoside phosphotransferase (APT) family kinase protein
MLEDSPAAQRLLNGRELLDVRRWAGKYSSSCSIEDVELVFADGSVAPLVLKDLGRDARLPEAARVKPAFLLDPRREIETYRNILGPYELGAPAMIGAAMDEATQRYLLLLKKVEGVPLWQVGDLGAWRAAARWQAATHARLAADAAALATPARLLRYDEAYYARWHERAESALRRASRPDAHRLLRAYCTGISLLLRLKPTFIHGEFHASNVLVEPLPAGVRITPVDWEMAALGPGLMDLADLTAGKWTPAQRQMLADAYREAAAAAGAPTGPEFERELAYCRLHRAVQWLSWSPDWSPPREHAQDWLGEAMLACEVLSAGGHEP